MAQGRLGRAKIRGIALKISTANPRNAMQEPSDISVLLFKIKDTTTVASDAPEFINIILIPVIVAACSDLRSIQALLADVEMAPNASPDSAIVFDELI